eukprot:NODE_1121_length_668_cov_633.080775_g878_i0.p1 GENE.NODE_1121_length_668_cov_633.080775_g878_i0~~NODE_1121_length_668_cov_633.080775_g878_i0.p1  ORF type:complete len:182 (-),score=14.84 NODE_1121_length_668_cov_633.080775_g878_i0:90-635(-)
MGERDPSTIVGEVQVPPFEISEPFSPWAEKLLKTDCYTEVFDTIDGELAVLMTNVEDDWVPLGVDPPHAAKLIGNIKTKKRLQEKRLRDIFKAPPPQFPHEDIVSAVIKSAEKVPLSLEWQKRILRSKELRIPAECEEEPHRWAVHFRDGYYALLEEGFDIELAGDANKKFVDCLRKTVES